MNAYSEILEILYQNLQKFAIRRLNKVAGYFLCRTGGFPGTGQKRPGTDIPSRALLARGGYPLTPPEASPLTRFFSMHMKRITTGMMAKMEAAKRYCHSIML